MSHKNLAGIVLSVTLVGLISLLPLALLDLQPVSAGQTKLEQFQSYQQMVDFLNSSQNVSPYYSLYRGSGTMIEVFNDVSSYSGLKSPDYSKTNIQVAGVDEADIVKSDGEYVYMASDGKVLIVKAYPPQEAEVVASIEINGTVSGIYVNGDKLVVVIVPNQLYGYFRDSVAPMGYGYSESAVWVYNIADRSTPVLARNVTLEGSYFNSRMIGDYVYVFVNSYAYIAEKEVPLPCLLDNGRLKTVAATSVYYSNASDSSYVFTTILAINTQDDEEAVVYETILHGYTSCVYVSLDNIYLASPTYKDGQMETEIHKIHIDGPSITCEASGEVHGYVLNQYSMDEYNGYFRIATTVGHVSRFMTSATSSNNVYVLGANMTVIGSLEDLAPGEKIYSARFMGERCYLVTFKKIDPLFVISLEDPYNPTVLGKLKIPGYSDYLHPYDENHLIGIGKNTVEAEEGDFAWYQGVKISLFDVTDVENPIETASFVIGDRGTDSPVLRDPKALLFDRERNLLVIPVLVAEINSAQYPDGNVPDNAYGDYVWQGAYVFNITASSITLRGGITHIENNTDYLKSGYYFQSQYSVQRALYIDNVLYTLSSVKIKLNSLADLSEIGEIALP